MKVPSTYVGTGMDGEGFNYYPDHTYSSIGMEGFNSAKLQQETIEKDNVCILITVPYDDSTVSSFDARWTLRKIEEYCNAENIEFWNGYVVFYDPTSVRVFYSDIVEPMEEYPLLDAGSVEYYNAKFELEREAWEECIGSIHRKLYSDQTEEQFQMLVEIFQECPITDRFHSTVREKIHNTTGPDYSGEFWYDEDKVLAILLECGMLGYNGEEDLVYTGGSIIRNAMELEHMVPLFSDEETNTRIIDASRFATHIREVTSQWATKLGLDFCSSVRVYGE